MKNLLYLLFMLLLSSWQTVYGQNCDLIAQYGIYDTHTTNISRERAISYLHLFKRDVNMTYEQAKDYSASIGIPIEGVLVELGLTASEDSYRKFVESVQAMSSLDEYYIEKTLVVSRTVNRDMVEVLKNCYSQDGIHTRIETTEDADLFYLVVQFNWTGNHQPARLKLSWAAGANALTINGERKVSQQLIFEIDNGEEQRYSIKRSSNIAIPFSLNVTRSGSGGTVRIRSGQMTIYKAKTTPPTMGSVLKFDKIKDQILSRTSQAQHVGNGDEELKRFETTHLTGNFSIGHNSKKILGVLRAAIKEEGGDQTAFSLAQEYNLYEAPAGYRIIGYRITGYPNNPEANHITDFDVRQSTWIKTEHASTGPIYAYTWQGDTGRDQDQIEGCWIQPHLKEITIILERE